MKLDPVKACKFIETKTGTPAPPVVTVTDNIRREAPNLNQLSNPYFNTNGNVLILQYENPEDSLKPIRIKSAIAGVLLRIGNVKEIVVDNITNGELWLDSIFWDEEQLDGMSININGRDVMPLLQDPKHITTAGGHPFDKRHISEVTIAEHNLTIRVSYV